MKHSLLFLFLLGSLALITGCAAHHPALQRSSDSTPGKDDGQNLSLAHDFFLRARSMELEGNTLVALQYYQLAFRYNSTSRDLCFLLLDRLRDAGQVDSAILLGHACFALAGEPTSAEYQSLGQAYLEKDDARSALPYYRQAVNLNDDDRDALYILAAIYEKLQDLPDYAATLRKLLPQLDYPSRLMDKLMQAYATLHQLDSIAPVLRAAWEDGQETQYGEDLATYYETRSQNRNFLEVAEELSRQNPDVRAYDLMRARALRAADMPDSALVVYRVLLQKDPDNRDAEFAYGDLLEQQGNNEAALPVFKKLVQEDPQNAAYHYSLGSTALDLRRVEAGPELERALSLEPAEPDYWARLIYADLVFHHDSLSAFRLSHLPDSMNLGWQTSFFHGLVNVLLARQLEPDGEEGGNPSPLKDSAAAIDHRRAASNLFRDALVKSPDNPLVLFELGTDLERLGQRDSAIQVLRPLVKADTMNAVAMNYLGYILIEDNQDVDFAGRLIDRALMLDPENGAYLDSKGWWYYQKGDFQSARSELQQALEHLPKDPTVLEHMAKVLEALGDKDAAHATWLKILQVEPGNAEALTHGK